MYMCEIKNLNEMAFTIPPLSLPLSCPPCTRGLGTGGDAWSFVDLILLVPNEQGHPPSLPPRGPGGGRGRGEECDSRGQSDQYNCDWPAPRHYLHDQNGGCVRVWRCAGLQLSQHSLHCNNYCLRFRNTSHAIHVHVPLMSVAVFSDTEFHSTPSPVCSPQPLSQCAVSLLKWWTTDWW